MTVPGGLASLLSAVRKGANRNSRLFWRGIITAARRDKRMAPPEARNAFWSVETYAEAMATYVAAFRHLKTGKYYKGWCALEQVELTLQRILDNPRPELIGKLAVDRAETVALWQSAFPYKIFASPGFLYQDWSCTICGRKSTPIDPCGHTVGKVYAGELCAHRITKMKILEISLVRDPVQKYSVLTPEDREHDFSMVAYIVRRLDGPFHPWTGEWTYKRHPHEGFAQHGTLEPCPCGSTLRYSECCLPEPGVRLKHFAMQMAGDAPFEQGVVFSGLKPELES